MKRDIYSKLVAWKNSARRKPLILKGARQVGKTYILQEFGKREYNRVAYFNFEEVPHLDDLFHPNLDPDAVLSNLSIQAGFEIKPEGDLVILDEIQNSNSALNSLKYFKEKRNAYHIAAAGSLLGIILSKPKSFPVGQVNFLDLYPLTFLEFLNAIKKRQLRVLIESAKRPNPFPLPFHEELIRLLRIYYFIGGMPEVVKEYGQTGDLKGVRVIQREIIDSYLLDFAKHCSPADIPKVNRVWESVPSHLGKENKKFIFSRVRPGVRAREYENALQWLVDAGLVNKSYQVTAPKQPLKTYSNHNIFKVFTLDVGLLGAMSNIPASILIEGDRLFTEFKGAFVENYVAQQLIGHFQVDIFYWTSEGSAEVDFLVEHERNIVPLEAKAGINPQSKSVRVYRQKFSPDTIMRASLLNLKQDGDIINLPLYAISRLIDFIEGVKHV